LKRTILSVLALSFIWISSWGIAMATPLTLAVWPMTYNPKISSEQELLAAENNLYENLVLSGKYNILDRSKLKAIVAEQLVQSVNEADNLADICKTINANKIVFSRLSRSTSGGFTINLKIVDVASGRVEYSKEITAGNYSAATLGKFAAAEIIMKYPLLGQVVDKSGNYYTIDIGTDQGIKEGDRIFVSRKNPIPGDNGDPLFEKQIRIGTIKITSANEKTALAELSSLETAAIGVATGDDISPEPIPFKKPIILTVPSLGTVKAGKLILNDNIQQKYLTGSNNNGPAYHDGKLDLDAREIKAGHVYFFYPTPYNQLADYILEGEFSFQQPLNEYHSTLTISFRSNGNYEKQNAYELFINNNGRYSVDLALNGQIFPLVPTQNSYNLLRGNGPNKFKLVIVGSHVDIYINDKFLTGFIDERYDKGSLGFMTFKGSHTQIKNVEIREISAN